MRICGTVRANKKQSAFWRKGDVIAQVWKDKRLVQMTSKIHHPTIVTTERKEIKINLDMKKPYAVFQYDEFIKGRPVPSYYLVLRKCVT